LEHFGPFQHPAIHFDVACCQATKPLINSSFYHLWQGGKAQKTCCQKHSPRLDDLGLKVSNQTVVNHPAIGGSKRFELYIYNLYNMA